jgi:hypothetical protein
MAELEIQTQNPYTKNEPYPFRRTPTTYKRSTARLATILPNGKYSRQTQRRRWLGKESLAMLYMETMEETRKEKEKPVTTRR